MIKLKTTATLTHVPRAGQFTTEYMREQHERLAGTPGFKSEWVEPSRSGGSSEGRYTTLRVTTEGDDAQVGVDFWITESRVGKAAFDRVLALEPGARVQLDGKLVHDVSYWHPRITRVRVLPNTHTPKETS